MKNFLDICLLSFFFTWIPLDLFHVSCFITVFSFIIFDTSECQHSHYLVIEKITSSFWRILFAKSLIFFLLNLHWNIYVRHQEHWTAKTITKHRLKYFDFFSRENIKIILTLTGWKCSENCQISSQSLLSTNSASEKTAKFFSKWSNYEKFISQRKVWYIFQYKKF